jgi:hypothetical protein
VLESNIDAVRERMGRFDVLLTAVLTGPLVAAGAAEMVDRLSHASITAGAGLVASAARLRDGGAMLRMAGTSVEQTGQALRAYLAFLSPLVGDDLWSRKW